MIEEFHAVTTGNPAVEIFDLPECGVQVRADANNVAKPFVSQLDAASEIAACHNAVSVVAASAIAAYEIVASAFAASLIAAYVFAASESAATVIAEFEVAASDVSASAFAATAIAASAVAASALAATEILGSGLEAATVVARQDAQVQPGALRVIATVGQWGLLSTIGGLTPEVATL